MLKVPSNRDLPKISSKRVINRYLVSETIIPENNVDEFTSRNVKF